MGCEVLLRIVRVPGSDGARPGGGAVGGRLRATDAYRLKERGLELAREAVTRSLGALHVGGTDLEIVLLERLVVGLLDALHVAPGLAEHVSVVPQLALPNAQRGLLGDRVQVAAGHALVERLDPVGDPAAPG